QRANKTTEAIDALQTFLSTFPKSRMIPGVKIRLALALQDNHKASEAIAMLRDLLASTPEEQARAHAKLQNDDAKDESEADDEKEESKSGDEKSDDLENAESGAVGWGKPDPSEWASLRFMSDSEGYPTGEKEWNAADSAAYYNMSGTDEEQIYQLI